MAVALADTVVVTVEDADAEELAEEDAVDVVVDVDVAEAVTVSVDDAVDDPDDVDPDPESKAANDSNSNKEPNDSTARRIPFLMDPGRLPPPP